MGRPEEVAEMISRGLTPTEIARDLDVSSSAVLGYLQTAVGKGLIRRSDIYFTLRLETRPSPTTREDNQVVARFGSVADAMGDMYADLAHIEVSLPSKIRLGVITLMPGAGVRFAPWMKP